MSNIDIDRSWFDEIEADHTDEIKLDFALAVERALNDSGVSRAELSRRVGSSSAWITKVLRGDANLTIETMQKIAAAMGQNVHIHLARKAAKVRWLESHFLQEVNCTIQPALEVSRTLSTCEVQRSSYAPYKRAA